MVVAHQVGPRELEQPHAAGVQPFKESLTAAFVSTEYRQMHGGGKAPADVRMMSERMGCVARIRQILKYDS